MQSFINLRNKLALQSHWRLDHLDEFNELFVKNAANAVLETTDQNMHVKDVCVYPVAARF